MGTRPRRPMSEIASLCYLLDKIVTWEYEHGLDVDRKSERLKRLIERALKDGDLTQEQAYWLLEYVPADHTDCNLCEAGLPLAEWVEA